MVLKLVNVHATPNNKFYLKACSIPTVASDVSIVAQDFQGPDTSLSLAASKIGSLEDIVESLSATVVGLKETVNRLTNTVTDLQATMQALERAFESFENSVIPIDERAIFVMD